MRYHHRTTPMLPHAALHPVFETLGYAGGYALYRAQRSRRGDVLSPTTTGGGSSPPPLALSTPRPSTFAPSRRPASTSPTPTRSVSSPSTPTTSSTATTSNKRSSLPCALHRPSSQPRH